LPVLFTALLSAQERTFDLKDYRIGVTVTPPPQFGGESPQVTFHVRCTPTGRESTIVVANYTQAVDSVFLPEPGKLVAIGELDVGSRIISVMDLRASRLVDTVWAWQPSVSHNLRNVAYGFRIPPHGLPLFRSAVLLLYDFRPAPEAIPHGRSVFPEEKGFILYPRRNRVEGKYELPSERPRVFCSPIAWSGDDDRIAVVDANEGVIDAVIVSIAKGPTEPLVTKWSVDATLFLKDAYKGVLPEEYRHMGTLPISQLQFANGGSALEMTSIDAGPFARKTVRLSLADGSEAVVSAPPPPQAHVEVPPNTPFIRVGGAVQDGALLHKVEPAYQGEKGGVEFEALIGPDGRVRKVVPLHGPAALVGPAEKAVMQWVYRPTLLNGRPVAVVTTVEVSFRAQK
jgi:hypothetical protein